MALDANPAGMAAVIVRQVVDRAPDLGLVWSMRKATVANGSNPAAVTAVMDGDSAAVSMVSTIGPLSSSTRVWVMVVPSGGNYISSVIGGAASNYTARQTLTATAASITFSGIPAGLRRMRVSFQCRADNATTVQFLQMRVNGDTGSSYSYQYGLAQNAAFVAAPGAATTSAIAGLCTAATAIAGIFASGQIELVGWDDGGTAGSGHLNYTFVTQGLGPTTATFTTVWGGGVYLNTRPFTSLTFFPQTGNFVAGTDIQLEGWPS